ncbi:alpha/beta fold hydrolase [Paenibacillus oralis]|nr:alpha/beta hydrolase [Paenibacillus oralis]
MVIFIVLLGFVAIMLAALYGYNQKKLRKAEMDFPPSGKFVKADGIRLHYLERGQGRPVVFLHGGVLRGHDFDQVMELAAAKGYRALAFDRPGYGHSARPKHRSVTPIDQAKLLHEALTKLGVDRPILVGHSWSGLLVLSYASLYPGDLAGIVTLGGGMYKEGYPAEKGDPISSIVTMPVVGPIVMNLLLAALGSVMVRQIIKATFAPEPLPADYERETLALWLRPSQFRANREDVLAFAPAASEMSPNYRRILAPAVIVVGLRDPFPTKEHSYRLHRDMPNAALIELPHAAHMIPQHHPQAVIDAVEKLPHVSRHKT